MKKTCAVFAFVLVCATAQSQMTVFYNNKQFKVTENSIVKDTVDKTLAYEEWRELLYTGDYNISPINPEDNNTYFRIKKMGDVEREKFFSQTRKPEETSYFKTGKQFPFFKGMDMNEKPIDTKQLAGKVLVINFWFINCLPCRKEMPALNKLVSKYAKDSSIIFIAIARDKKPEIETFLKTTSLDYRIICDGENLVQKYGIEHFPTNLVINREGKIIYHTSLSGPVPDYWLEKAVEEAKN
jgi:thiol-disulfide isomerase/thioredoxin